MNLDEYSIILNYTVFNWCSFLNALVFSSIFAFVLCVICKRTSWMIKLGLWPVFLFVCLAIIRLILPIELPFSRIIGSWTLLPAIQDFFRISVFQLGENQIQIIHVLMMIWALGTSVLICRFIWQWIFYVKKCSCYPSVSEEMKNDLKSWIPGFSGDARIVEEDSVPYLSGFFRPVIFLPGVNYEIRDLRLICLHEWQHFCGHDQWVKLLCYLLCCLFWWNPLMWILKKNVDQLLEVRCDFSVLRKLEKEEQVDYYTMLLNIYQSIKREKHNKPQCVSALASSNHHEIILQRFQMGRNFLQMQKPSKVLSMVFSGVLVVAFCVSYGAIFQPQSLPPTAHDGDSESVEDPIFSEFPEDSYLTPNEDGSYTLHLDGLEINVPDITEGPVASLPIVE